MFYEKTKNNKIYGVAGFINPLTYITDGNITYKSSNTAVATVGLDGKVTIKGIGTTIITAMASKGEQYTSAAACYTLTVKAPIISATLSISNKLYGYDDIQTTWKR